MFAIFSCKNNKNQKLNKQFNDQEYNRRVLINDRLKNQEFPIYLNNE